MNMTQGVVVLGGLVLLFAAGPAVSADSEPSVKIEKHILVGSSQGPVRAVSFQYDFPGLRSVHIKGLGNVPARGTFNYLTQDTTLQFLDSRTGKLILDVPLKNPRQMMGDYSVTLPAQTEFPPAFRSGRWTRTDSFQVHLTDTLNARFPSGFLVLRVEGSNAVITTYRDLESVSEPLFGRLAVMVESPASPSADLTFRVHVLTQERRSRTNWQELSTQEVQRAAEKYVSSLVKEIEGSVQ